MQTALGWLVLAMCWWVIAVEVVAIVLFLRIPRSELTQMDALARVLETGGEQWCALWEGQMSWPSFQEWFRSRLAEEERRSAPASERWPYECYALGMEFVELVFRFRSDHVRARRRHWQRVLSGV